MVFKIIKMCFSVYCGKWVLPTRWCSGVCLWYENVLDELGLNCKYIEINVDNKAATYNSENETINPKSMHIDIKYYRIKELVKSNKKGLIYIKSLKT